MKREDLQCEWFSCHAQGKRTDSTRVDRCFPMIYEWGGTFEFVVLDETITPDILEEMVSTAGRFVGFGRFAPRNGGLNGRFQVKGIEMVRL